MLLDRLAVAGRRERDVVDAQGVRDPSVGEQGERLPGAGAVDPADAVVVADPDARHVGERLLPLAPAVAGDDDPGVLIDDVVFLAVLDRLRWPLDPGPALVLVGVGDLAQLVPDDPPPGGLVVEQLLDRGGALALLGQLAEDVRDFELAQAVELGFEHGVGLQFGESEPRDQLRRGVGLAVAGPDDPDRLVQVVEDDREPFEDVNAALQEHAARVTTQSASDFEPKSRKCYGILLRSEPGGDGHRGSPAGRQAGEVDVEIRLKQRVLE